MSTKSGEGQTSFGTQSEAGTTFVERILTVTGSLRRQQRNVLDYLAEACEAALHGRAAPSLLPSVTLTSAPQAA